MYIKILMYVCVKGEIWTQLLTGHFCLEEGKGFCVVDRRFQRITDKTPAIHSTGGMEILPEFQSHHPR